MSRRGKERATVGFSTAQSRYGVTVRWSEENAGYIASTPEFPSVSAIGDTIEEAVIEWTAVLESTLSIYAEEGWDLPDPMYAP